MLLEMHSKECIVLFQFGNQNFNTAIMNFFDLFVYHSIKIAFFALLLADKLSDAENVNRS